MMRQFILLMLLSLTTSVLYAGSVYKCKTPQGKFRYQKSPCDENNEEISSWTPKTEVKKTTDEPDKKKTPALVLKQGAGGHYFLRGDVNSHSISFVVDTGATVVSLPKAVAMSANMFCNEKVLMDTAGGRSGGCSTIITELKLGEFVFKNVTAVIVPKLTQPLLGMNVLRHFDIEQKDGEMRLSERESK